MRKTSPYPFVVAGLGLALATAWFLRGRLQDDGREFALRAPEQLDKPHESRREQVLTTPTPTDTAGSSQGERLEPIADIR